MENDIEAGLHHEIVPGGRQTHAPSSLPSTRGMNLEHSHGKNELVVFQTLVGIRFLAVGGQDLPKSERQRPLAPVLQDIFLPSRAAAARFCNRGLYDRALSQDTKNRVMYGLASYTITSLYLLQILVAAALTGLSASHGSSNIPLTVLGAINTVLAGILAWLTGQGMPVRFRRARDQYREVVHAIEMAERTFAEIDSIYWPPGTRPTPTGERDRLERLYNDARIDQEANYPDSQSGPGLEHSEGKQDGIHEELRRFKAESEKGKEEISALLRELDRLRGPHAEKAVGGVNGADGATDPST